MGSKKIGVKKGSAQARSYAARNKAITEATRQTLFYDGMQYALDIASVVLNEEYGFGPDRLKRFGSGFSKKFAEVQDRSRADDDKDRWYSEEQFEAELRNAWGPYYTPRKERYKEDDT